MSIWREVKFVQSISKQWPSFADSKVDTYVIFLVYTLFKGCWNCDPFGGNFAQLWVVLIGLWPFEGWLSFKSWFQDNDMLLHILRSIMIQIFWYAYCWKSIEITHHLVVLLLNFEFTHANVMKAMPYWRSSIRYVLLVWSGNICGLLISCSSPHRFHKRNLHIYIDIWKVFFILFMWLNFQCVFSQSISFLWQRGPIFYIIQHVTPR